MFGSQVIDIALGLVLVFLLMSVVLTAVQESLEAWLRTRAGDLNRAIYELLQNDHDLLQSFYDHPLIFALHRSNLDSNAAVKAVARSLSIPVPMTAAVPVADANGANAKDPSVPSRGEARAARR